LKDLLSLPEEIISQEDEERFLKELKVFKNDYREPGISDLGYALGGIDLVQKVVRVVTTVVIKASIKTADKAGFILSFALTAEQNREHPEEYFLAVIEGFRSIARLAPQRGLPFRELGRFLLNPKYRGAAFAVLEVFRDHMKRADPEYGWMHHADEFLLHYGLGRPERQQNWDIFLAVVELLEEIWSTNNPVSLYDTGKRDDLISFLTTVGLTHPDPRIPPVVAKALQRIPPPWVRRIPVNPADNPQSATQPATAPAAQLSETQPTPATKPAEDAGEAVDSASKRFSLLEID
jgi:hypothetical protein